MKYLISYLSHEIVSGFNSYTDGTDIKSEDNIFDFKWLDELFYDASQDTHHKDNDKSISKE